MILLKFKESSEYGIVQYCSIIGHKRYVKWN